ncbi:hypothetical protein BB560_005185 [Smittium megazygosporum]|uniref:Vacuolar protein sorting-associated protein 35 n=1 Tax=Smittium megazygosporum TaxID=133381 RepID=A0A2T9Z7B2_9FUNG|nr:hypothetical protein BB560_005185 [Smittium megazygosporum]
MEALKHCSNILNQLRISSLSPKDYSELFFSVFDSLQTLIPFLKDLHRSGKQNLADLYELVQYAGSVVTRLYLMITVGSAYISLYSVPSEGSSSTPSEDIPVKEVLYDMLEMTRGVQHPLRGLFLRDVGNIDDSINFLLSNFTEMNKLWVRMQHQGLSRDRTRREEERHDLQTLVGSNLLRLSLLEGVSQTKYHDVILPSMLSQIVSCKDALAQEYLMEATVQAFSDEYHLETLGMLVSTLSKLHPKVAVCKILSSLVERVTLYFSQNKVVSVHPLVSDNYESTPNVHKSPNLANEKQHPIEDKMPSLSINPKDNKTTVESESNSVVSNPENESLPDDSNKTPKSSKSPDQSTNTEPASSEINHDSSQSTEKLDDSENSVKEDGLAAEDLKNPSQNPTINSVSTDYPSLDSAQESSSSNSPLASAVGPISSTPKDLKDKVSIPTEKISTEKSVINTNLNQNYEGASEKSSFSKQPKKLEISILLEFWDHVEKLILIRSDLPLSEILSVCNVMLKMALLCAPESIDFANTILDFASHQIESKQSTTVENPSIVSKNILTLLITPLRVYANPLGVLDLIKYKTLLDIQPIKIRKNLSIAFITLLLQREIVISDYKTASTILSLCIYSSSNPVSNSKENSNEYGLIARLQAISMCLSLAESTPELVHVCFNLYLHTGQILSSGTAFNNVNKIEEAALEFYIETMTVYESITSSNHQLLYLLKIISFISSSINFSKDNYKTLADRCTLQASKLLRREDKCRATLACSFLFWRTLTGYELWELDNQRTSSNYMDTNDSALAHELIQKAIQIAEPCLDPSLVSLLYVEILNAYLIFFDHKCPTITHRAINDFIIIIVALFEKMDKAEDGQSSLAAELPQKSTLALNLAFLKSFDTENGDISPSKYFYRTITYIESKKNSADLMQNDSTSILNSESLYSSAQDQPDYSLIKTRF